MSETKPWLRPAGLLTGCLAVCLGACRLAPLQPVSLCGENGQLRVGVVGSEEGRAGSAQVLLPDAEIGKLRDLLTVASRCEVQLEPVASPEQARLRLNSSEWDAAFLPAGLAALALEGEGSKDYSLVRPLGQRRQSRARLLVRSDSEVRSLAQLNGRRLGLLPRGSLTGFYLPLYNLHGINLGAVHYALTYEELLEQLRSGRLDVIVWDSALPIVRSDVRVLHEDQNSVPSGALVLSQSLIAADHQPFLAALDEAGPQLPPSLGYVAGVFPEAQDLQRLRAVVNSVEGWDLPLEGRPYSVFGRRQPVPSGEVR